MNNPIDEIRAIDMTEDRVAKAIELLERIAAHDHQGAAIGALLKGPSGTEERLAVYKNILSEVASTDIQSWAQFALRHLRGEDAELKGADQG